MLISLCVVLAASMPLESLIIGLTTIHSPSFANASPTSPTAYFDQLSAFTLSCGWSMVTGTRVMLLSVSCANTWSGWRYTRTISFGLNPACAATSPSSAAKYSCTPVRATLAVATKYPSWVCFTAPTLTRSLNLILTPYKPALLSERAIFINCRFKARQDTNFCQRVYYGITERVKRDDLTGVSARQRSGSSGVLAEHLGRLYLGALAQRCPLVIYFGGTVAERLSDDAFVQQCDGLANFLALDIANAVIVNALVSIATTGQCRSSPTEQARNRNARRTRHPVEELSH